MRIAVIAVLLAWAWPAAGSDFAVEVIDYTPAPGQWVNDPDFNDPSKALGPPIGGGTNAAYQSSVVSLGGFGGSITLRFDHLVENDWPPDRLLNPMGLDFIVYGNAFWVGGYMQRRWGEPAHVEIMYDVNGDGLPGTHPDEVWYLVPGSLIDDPPGQYRQQQWDDDPGTPTPPANVYWFPGGQSSPYTTAGFDITTPLVNLLGGYDGVIENPNINDQDPDNDGLEGVWGYADMSPTLILGDMNGNNLLTDPQDQPGIAPELFYTVPDDPYYVGVTPGAGGGDAFNISNAINPNTGERAGLRGFHFIRITTAVDAVGTMGEVSVEIDAVADVRPDDCPGDFDNNGVVNVTDFTMLPELGAIPGDADWLPEADFDGNGVYNLTDFTVFARVFGTTCEE
jgi:hypothetical protein